MTETTDIGVVVLGASGYMAGNFFPAYRRCMDMLQNDRTKGRSTVRLRLIMAADPKLFAEPSILRTSSIERQIELLGAACTARRVLRAFTQSPPPILDNTSDLVGWELRESELDNVYNFPDLFLIYDASPAFVHFRNLTLFCGKRPPGYFYFGEKPIFVDPAQILDDSGWSADTSSQYAPPPIFCDFIETCNPAAVALKKFIADRNLKIEKISAWRTSSSGIKHLVGHEQKGVQGGALFDKSPHDLSLTTMLLGPDDIVDFCIVPEKTKIHDLIPNIQKDTLQFLGQDSKLHVHTEFCLDIEAKNDKEGTRLVLPADGYSSAAVRWKLSNGREVEAEYSFGWIGVCDGANTDIAPHPCEQSFVGTLERLGYSRCDWRFEEKYQGKNPDAVPCVETQARILIVDATHEVRGKVMIVANLISSHPGENQAGQQKLQRWVHAHWIDDVNNRETVYPVTKEELDYCGQRYEEQKCEDMAHILYTVARACAGFQRAEFLDTVAVKWVHQAMLAAHDHAIVEFRKNADYSHGANHRAFALISGAIVDALRP